jgi:putative endonuclease
MYYVYIIKSIRFPEIIYVGFTSNVSFRLKTHNNGGSIYTKEYKPWELLFNCCFSDKLKAIAFEKYLKSHSGKAFLQKRLI